MALCEDSVHGEPATSHGLPSTFFFFIDSIASCYPADSYRSESDIPMCSESAVETSAEVAGAHPIFGGWEPPPGSAPCSQLPTPTRKHWAHRE
jgi:hypothetical protein